MRKFMYDPGDEQEQSSGGGEQGATQTGTAATALPTPAPAPLTGQATDEQIAAWKKANPQGIYGIQIEDRIVYLSKPTWEEIDFAMSKADDEHPLAVGTELTSTTLLGGDETLLADPSTRMAVQKKVMSFVQGKEATLVNL